MKLLLLLIMYAFTISENVEVHHESELDLPKSHLPYTKKGLKNKNCWGYEKNCKEKFKFGKSYKGCVNNKAKEQFWKYNDFGYVQKVINELKIICDGRNVSNSYLKCSSNLRFCDAKNIYIDFKKLGEESVRNRYREDLFDFGMIGASCNLDESLLKLQNGHKSPLQSWYAELQNFTQLNEVNCDVTINNDVIMMKLDYGGNMYHHFCDFFNLYASQHVHGRQFNTNVTIIMWDTLDSYYFDPFNTTWQVFTNTKVIPLMSFAGKRVCLRGGVMFPLLARMRSGLYYNSFVGYGCSGSNLFKAFSEHVIHRMKVPLYNSIALKSQNKLKVTLLQRSGGDHVYRKINNLIEIEKVLREFTDLEVEVVEFDWRKVDFQKQLEITHNSDIFIGMHGAGLTHFLFLPDWAVAFELYNCGDVNCYKDLARQRGVTYITWTDIPDAPSPVSSHQGKHPRYGKNPKFWNYSFDLHHFKSLVQLAREKVLNNLREKSHKLKDEL